MKLHRVRLALLFWASLLPHVVLALTEKIPNWLKSATLVDFLKKILESVVELALMVLVVTIVIVGYMFVSAHGNEQRLATAKRAFVWVLIGGAVILGAWAITDLVVNTITAVKS